MEDLTRFAALFDWITPVTEFVKAAMYGERRKTFTTDDSTDCTDIMTLLGKHSIAILDYGYDAWEDWWYVEIDEKDYAYACYVLQKYGWKFA